MSVSFPVNVTKSKVSRDVILKDVVMRDQPSRPVAVAAGTVIGPDQILVTNTISPLTVKAAVAEDLAGAATYVGVSVGYGTATALVDGEVMRYLNTEGQTARIVVEGPAPVIGERYDIIDGVDANGYITQKLDTSAPVATSTLLVEEYDALSNVASVALL